MNVVAPGKVFLFGEYAVLDGAPALVLSVSRFARARVGSGATPSDLYRWTLEAFAAERADDPPGPDTARTPLPASLDVDTSSFQDGGVKLGLGSSAAACVASAAMLYFKSGESLASTGIRRSIFKVARAVHDRLQGERGSGADVAASVEGGLLRYEMSDRGRYSPVQLPVPLRLVFVPTGVAASTRLFLARVRELRGAQSEVYNRRMGVLCELAHEMATDLGTRPAADACLLVHSYVAHLDALGRDAGVPIVSEPHRRIIEVARSCGCAAKPSGAGGGDLAVVFCPDASSALAVREALTAAGFPPLDLEPDSTGVRLEMEDDAQRSDPA